MCLCLVAALLLITSLGLTGDFLLHRLVLWNRVHLCCVHILGPAVSRWTIPQSAWNDFLYLSWLAFPWSPFCQTLKELKQINPEDGARHLDLCFVVGVCVLEGNGWRWEPSGKHAMWGTLSGLGMFEVMRRKCRWSCKHFQSLVKSCSEDEGASLFQKLSALGRRFGEAWGRLPEPRGCFLTWAVGGLSTPSSSLEEIKQQLCPFLSGCVRKSWKLGHDSFGVFPTQPVSKGSIWEQSKLWSCSETGRWTKHEIPLTQDSELEAALQLSGSNELWNENIYQTLGSVSCLTVRFDTILMISLRTGQGPWLCLSTTQEWCSVAWPLPLVSLRIDSFLFWSWHPCFRSLVSAPWDRPTKALLWADLRGQARKG